MGVTQAYLFLNAKAWEDGGEAWFSTYVDWYTLLMGHCVLIGMKEAGEDT